MYSSGILRNTSSSPCPNAPQNKTFTLDDGTEVEGVLKEVNEVEDTDTWVDFTIDGQVVIPEGATAYVYLGKVHPPHRFGMVIRAI